MALLSVIAGAFKMIGGLIMALFVMLIESSFLALPLWVLYTIIRPKFDLPVLSYVEVMYILLGIKILKFSSFDMAKMNANLQQENLISEEDEKTSEA